MPPPGPRLTALSDTLAAQTTPSCASPPWAPPSSARLARAGVQRRRLRRVLLYHLLQLRQLAPRRANRGRLLRLKQLRREGGVPDHPIIDDLRRCPWVHRPAAAPLPLATAAVPHAAAPAIVGVARRQRPAHHLERGPLVARALRVLLLGCVLNFRALLHRVGVADRRHVPLLHCWSRHLHRDHLLRVQPATTALAPH